MRSSIIALALHPEYWDKDESRPAHVYFGSIHTCSTYFVKDFKDGEVVLTRCKSDAKHFTNDDDCTRCMEALVTRGVWTIATWQYKNCELLAQMVNYPNERWGNNHKLMPSLMHRSVIEFYAKKGDKYVCR